MNIYRRQFVNLCPNNNAPILYQLTIETEKIIMVEHLVLATSIGLLGSQYHENIADTLHAQFGGRQTLTAHHHGVDIETRRGFA